MTTLAPAEALLSGALRSDDRVLVTGSGGWFGSTTLQLLSSLEAERVLPTASTERSHSVVGRIWPLTAWSWEEVKAFEPTAVVNAAFLTRERVTSDGEESFTTVNQELTDRFLQSLALPSVRAALTISSGAAITEPDHPYGRMKLAEETAALEAVRPGLAVVIARAWSVSGELVRRPRDYAFSDFVLQAREGEVRVRDARFVYRRYVDVADLVAVSLHSALAGWSGVIDSGGELVELGDLATRIAAAVAPQATVSLPSPRGAESSSYASDGTTWRQACERVQYEPLNLQAQIRKVVRDLPEDGVLRRCRTVLAT